MRPHVRCCTLIFTRTIWSVIGPSPPHFPENPKFHMLSRLAGYNGSSLEGASEIDAKVEKMEERK